MMTDDQWWSVMTGDDAQEQSKIHPKSYQFLNYFSDRFLINSAAILEAKLARKSVKHSSKSDPRSNRCGRRFWHPFVIDFWWKLGATTPSRHAKNIEKPSFRRWGLIFEMSRFFEYQHFSTFPVPREFFQCPVLLAFFRSIWQFPFCTSSKNLYKTHGSGQQKCKKLENVDGIFWFFFRLAGYISTSEY